MGTVRRKQAHPVPWALLLCHLFLLGYSRAQSTSPSVPECSCETFSAAPKILNNGYTSICPCSYGKVTLIPATFTTVFTIYDPVTSDGLVSASGLTTLPSASRIGASNTTTLGSVVSTISNSVSYSTPWSQSTNLAISSGKSSTIHLSYTSTSSGVFRTGYSTVTNDKITSGTFFRDDTTKGFSSSSLGTPGSIHALGVFFDSSELTTLNSLGSSAAAANPTASSTLPAQTTSTVSIPNTQRTTSEASSTSRLPPSPENGSTVPSSSSQLIASTTDPASAHTTTTKSGGGGGSGGGSDKDDGDDGKGDGKDDGDGKNDGNDGENGENGDSGNDNDDSNDDDDDNGDNNDDDDDDSFLAGFRIDLGINLGIDLGIDLGSGFATSILGNALRDIFGLGMSTGFGTNVPSGGGEGGGGENGEIKPDKPKESLTTSKATSSCTVTYTLAPHCTQPCVVSHIKSLGTSSYTTNCATATCRTTRVCTSVRSTTTTSFTTKRPERTAACMPKKCPACQENTPEVLSRDLGARWGSGDEAILKDTITEPDTWAGGEHDWWEKMRRLAKTYGPGLHLDSVERMDSSSSWTPFINTPHGGGAEPVWGCVMVVAFSPKGVFASHLWEIPNFAISEEEYEYFNVGDGMDVDYYFKQNVETFLQKGSAEFPHQEQYPALAPLVDAGGPLNPKDSGFFRTIVFVPTHETGEMVYKSANRRLLNFLSDKIKIEKKYITVYGYTPRLVLGNDFDYDNGVATPPPEIRAANPWDGLFSWLYTPKGPSGQRELVVRYEKSVVHREAWCGIGRAVPDAPPSNFDLRPNRPPAGLRPARLRSRQEDATCGRFILCGLSGPEGLCGDYRKIPPPALSDQPQKRQLLPANGPSRAERDLSTDTMIDPKVADGGESWWWNRMRNVVNDRGAGYGGHPVTRESWATSTFVTLDQEADGTAADRPRFGGSGPIWGCSAIVVASPEAVWTSQVWEIPSHARGEAHGRATFEFWKQHYTRPTVEYFREGFLDFLDDGNEKGNFKQQHDRIFPGRNPGLKDMFMEKGPFNVKEKEFVWVGIVTRSYRNLDVPRVQYDWQIQQVFERFVAWGVEPENIMVKAYPARMDFVVGGPQIPPHWGILSWQYHPRHREGSHEEKKIRIRFEKKLFFEKSWCGSGAKMAGSGGKAPSRRRREDIEACKMAVSSRESASATRVETTALPEPTMACTNDATCGPLSCPENRISACHRNFCHCVILANPNNTEVLTGTVYATSTTTLGASKTPIFPVLSLPPSVTTTARFMNTSLKSSTSMSTLTNVSSTRSSLSSTSSTTVFMSNLTVTSSGISSTVSSMFTHTTSAWNPEEFPGRNCTVKHECSALKCPDGQYPDCHVNEGSKPGCHCFDKPKKLLDACSKASECANIECETRHSPACRPLVDDPDAISSCHCDAIPVAPGATCLVDTHCDGLPCDAANKRGLCLSNACRCDFFLPEGVGCVAHDDCSPIRCSEAKPHKACSEPSNACACSDTAPAPRRAEGDRCSAAAECATIGCTDFEANVCEAGACRCRATKCGSDKDYASSSRACGGGENLRCEGSECVCKRCTATTKVLGCGLDGDCNHCCERGRLPKCVYGCQSFWCGKECQCEAW